jgi:hypothetical protein
MKFGKLTVAASVALLAGCMNAADTPQSSLGFFVTSVGSGKGADLGGLAGADALCQKLGTAAGAGGRTWRAYLSTQPSAGVPAVNARDRIGRGPWANAKGVVIAQNVADLHGDTSKLTKESALTETGAMVNGRVDKPNMHDMLTGSQPDGTAFPGGEDRTCSNWTSSTTGSAVVGHHDRLGLTDTAPARSWNSSHPSKACSQEALISTGGNGYLYCFAAR